MSDFPAVARNDWAELRRVYCRSQSVKTMRKRLGFLSAAEFRWCCERAAVSLVGVNGNERSIITMTDDEILAIDKQLSNVERIVDKARGRLAIS